jgi:predicted NodU family carbamoyl transferase
LWDGHDSGAAILVDGRVTAAANEVRFTRRKLEVRFPSRAINCCLAVAGLDRQDIDVVAVATTDVAKTVARISPRTKAVARGRYRR